MKCFKNRRGFTLVELCVVMAMTAIIGTMVTAAILFYSNQSNDLQKDATFISDVSSIQQSVDRWLKKYDNDNYEKVTLLPNSKGLMTRKAGDTEKITLTFENNILKGSGNNDTLEGVKAIEFAFSEENPQIIKLTVSQSGKYSPAKQILLFPLFSGVERERSVTGRNK